MMVRPWKFSAVMRWIARGFAVMLVIAASVIGSMPRLWAQTQSAISAPAEGSTVNGDTTIIGTAVIDPFQKYELHYKQEPSGDDAYIYFAGGTSQVVNGPLGTWASAGLPPGLYSLRLRVVKVDGNYAEFFVRNITVNQGAPATPTSTTPTATPIPTSTFTPAPQPTAAVGAVEQPQVEGDLPTLTPTPAPGVGVSVDSGADAAGVVVTPSTPGTTSVVNGEGSSLTRELGAALSFDKLREQFWNGVRYSALIFFLVAAVLGGKRLLGWAWLRLR